MYCENNIKATRNNHKNIQHGHSLGLVPKQLNLTQQKNNAGTTWHKTQKANLHSQKELLICAYHCASCCTQYSTELVKILQPTRHKIGHFRDLGLKRSTSEIVSKWNFQELRFYRGLNWFSIFLLIFEWALQQSSATALPVVLFLANSYWLVPRKQNQNHEKQPQKYTINLGQRE